MSAWTMLRPALLRGQHTGIGDLTVALDLTLAHQTGQRSPSPQPRSKRLCPAAPSG